MYEYYINIYEILYEYNNISILMIMIKNYFTEPLNGSVGRA